MNNQELSTLTLTETGFQKLPENFEALSAKKQKAVMLELFQEQHIQVLDYLNEAEEIQRKIAKINEILKNSKQVKELKELRKELKHVKNVSSSILMERSGMIRMSKKLGYDLTKELTNIIHIANQ